MSQECFKLGELNCPCCDTPIRYCLTCGWELDCGDKACPECAKVLQYRRDTARIPKSRRL